MKAVVRPVGCIADDITGATDLAGALSARGLDTRIAFGSPAVRTDGADVIVVALKIRSAPPAEAGAAALEAAEALLAAGVEQLFFKYCSTFDSTAVGNIGPIADVLGDATSARRVVHCPAYPANGRTIYLGHLFVGDELLSESPMRDHPLNPMRDPRLPRVLAAQTRRRVALLSLATVAAGVNPIAARLSQIADHDAGAQHVIADAVQDADLDVIAEAVAGDPLAAGAAAFGAAFAVAAHARAGRRPAAAGQPAAPPPGPSAILAGSLSEATREQVREFDGATLVLSIGDLTDGDAAVRRALDFAVHALAAGPILITTDHDAPDAVRAVAGLSPPEVSRRIELAMGRIAVDLKQLGVRRFIVAGGETSGAVADALDLQSALVGPEISVGVPWIVTEQSGLAVAFKSGNFGVPSFFRDALDVAGA